MLYTIHMFVYVCVCSVFKMLSPSVFFLMCVECCFDICFYSIGGSSSSLLHAILFLLCVVSEKKYWLLNRKINKIFYTHNHAQSKTVQIIKMNRKMHSSKTRVCDDLSLVLSHNRNQHRIVFLSIDLVRHPFVEEDFQANSM